MVNKLHSPSCHAHLAHAHMIIYHLSYLLIVNYSKVVKKTFFEILSI